MRNFAFYIFATLFIAWFLISCSGENDPNYEIRIPPVAISCHQASSVDCVSGSSGKIVYVGLLSDTTLDCETELLKARSNVFYLFFDFSGSAATNFSGELEAEIIDWRDTENQEAFYMKNTSYRACAFLDMDNDGELDPTETIGELTFSATDDQPTIIDWH
ncbi:MAG: hypothetical protein KDD58_09515 [Bdellovibrionales bacterium]|nr:hypothetical protein [Bdellovibrionales bacterium]